ncbi:hypothetical protein ACUXCC_004771 [Cytobacillus horneckiae]
MRMKDDYIQNGQLIAGYNVQKQKRVTIEK